MRGARVMEDQQYGGPNTELGWGKARERKVENSRPFSMPLTAALLTALFTESIVSLTAEPESFCASGLVEKRTGLLIVAAANGARGALEAMVRRRDMVFVFFCGGGFAGNW